MRFFNSICSLICTAGVLFGCARSGTVSLTIKLPEALRKGSARYERFTERVVHLRLEISTDNGVRESLIVLPVDWSRIPLPDVKFPQGDKDSLEIVVEIWDRDLNRNPRTVPIAVGHAKVAAADVKAGETRLVVVPVALQISAREYDF